MRIRFADMEICTFILMSSLPAAWVVVGCLLLLLVVVMTILFLLKSREVNTLKKQCDELRDTMRMMRYEEANLARMLHTASKPVGPIEAPEEEDVEVAPEENVDGLESLETLECLEEQENQEQQEQQEQEKQESQEEQEELPVANDIEEVQAVSPQKQPISERRSALPVDLFSAWFAENEEEQEEPLVVSQTEIAEQVANVVAFQEEPATINEPTAIEEIATEEALSIEKAQPSEETVTLPTVEDEQEVVEAPQETELNKDDERFCRKLERIVTTRMRNPNLNIDIIAAQFGIGRTNFYRKVREVMGMSPNDYLRKCRMERAAELLRSTEDNVGEVCAQVGMPDAQYFSRVFKTYFGVSPSVYRENNNQ